MPTRVPYFCIQCALFLYASTQVSTRAHQVAHAQAHTDSGHPRYVDPLAKNKEALSAIT